MKYTEALKKLFEVMEGRSDIIEVKFDRENDSFDVISSTGVHVCFGSEFRNREMEEGWKKIESQDIDNSNIKIGDTVKVISTTIFNNKPEELIPIGSICKVTNIEYDSYAKQNAFELLPINHNYRYWYLEKEIEKGHMEWVKNK